MVFPDPGPSVGPGGRKVNRGRLSISNFQMKPGKSTTSKSLAIYPNSTKRGVREKFSVSLNSGSPPLTGSPGSRDCCPRIPAATLGQPLPPHLQGPRLVSGEGSVRRPSRRAVSGLPGLSSSHWGHQACRPSHAQACSGLSSGGSDGTESSTSAPGTAYRNQG